MEPIEDFYYQCETSAREFSSTHVGGHFELVSAFMRGAEWAFEKYSSPELLEENKRLRQELESLVKVAEPVFLIYDQEYEEHEMQAGRISPDGLFIALSSARAALKEQ